MKHLAILLLSLLSTSCLTAGYSVVHYGELGNDRVMSMDFMDKADPWLIPYLGEERRRNMIKHVFQYCGRMPHLTHTTILPESTLYTFKCGDNKQ